MRNNLKKIARLFRFGLCASLIFFSACWEDDLDTSSDTGSIAFSVEWQGAPTVQRAAAYNITKSLDCAASSIFTVEGKVYDEKNSHLAGGDPWRCDDHRGIIKGVTPGVNRKLIILGKDASGNVVYRGETTNITVNMGQRTEVGTINALLFVPTLKTPEVELTVINGAFSFEWATLIEGSEYRIQVSTDDSFTSTEIDQRIATNSYTPTIPLPAGRSYFRVKAIDGYGNESTWSEVGSFIVSTEPGIAPSAPTNVIATAGDEQTTISWDAASGAISYNIYWSTSSGVSKSNYEGNFADITSTSYIQTGLTNGITYYYVVTAENSSGESIESSEVDAKPEALLLPEALVAYWSFDNCDATDNSGNGYNGTLKNGPKCIDGIKGKAIFIDADNDYITLNKTFNPNNMKAISFWIKSRGTNVNNAFGTIIAKYNWGGYRSFVIRSYSDDINSIVVTFYSDGVSYNGDSISSYYENPESLDPDKFTVINNTELEINVWKHVVINTTTTEIEIWIDGTITNKVIRNYQKYFNSGEKTYIGNTFRLGADFDYNHQLNGTLDDFRIYNRPLSEAEIQALYTSQLESISVTPTNPTVTAGSSLQFSATGHYSNGSTQEITTEVIWGSSVPSAITISNSVGSDGLASITSVASTAITALDPATGIISGTTIWNTCCYFLDLSNVNLNGLGTSISVAPGNSISLTADYTIWSRSGCPGCIDWIAVGIESDGQDAYYVGIPGRYPGRSGSASITLTAPSSTGSYRVYALLSPVYTESDALSHYESDFPDTANFIPIGTIKVQ